MKPSLQDWFRPFLPGFETGPELEPRAGFPLFRPFLPGFETAFAFCPLSVPVRGSDRSFRDLKRSSSLIDPEVSMTSSDRSFRDLKLLFHAPGNRSFACSDRSFRDLKLLLAGLAVVGYGGSDRSFRDLKRTEWHDEYEVRGTFRPFLPGFETGLGGEAEGAAELVQTVPSGI